MIKLFNKSTVIYLLFGLILITHILILTRLIYFPYAELFIYPYLTNHGLKPYSQILDQHFPGLMFLPVNFDNLGMKTAEIARLWSISIVLMIHVMLFLISNLIFRSKTKALLVNFLYLIWQPFFEGWVLWIDNFLPLLLLPAFYAIYKEKYFLTGLLIGAAVVFKQTIIPLSFLVFVYIFWKNRSRKPVILFLSGLLIPILLVAIYLINIGVMNDFIYWTIIFNLTVYAQSGTKAPPSIAFITREALVYITSLLTLFNWRKREVQILFIFLLGSLLGAFERADFVHLQPSLPFAVLATIYGLNLLWGKRLIKLIFLMYCLIVIWWLNIFYKGHLSNNVLFFDPSTREIAAKIRQYTHLGEKIFVFGAAPHLYQMSDTLPAGDIFVYQLPWFLKVSEQRILEGLVKDKPNIIVSDRTITIEGAKIIDFAKDLDQYIMQNYQKIDSVGTADILQKRS